MEVTHLTETLSRGSWVYRWSVLGFLSFATMKCAFDIFLLNLGTVEVPFHCAEAVVDNATVAWETVNASSITTTVAGSNFSIADYKCVAPSFRREGPNSLVQTSSFTEAGPTCQSWTYYPIEVGRVNMLMEYDFVCDKAYLVDRIQTVLQAGMFIGCFFAPLADAFGRKLPFILLVYLELTSTVLAIFVTNLQFQMVLRFTIGLGSTGLLIGMAYMMELLSEEFHPMYGNFYWILWVLGYTASGLIAYLVLQWRHQIILVAVLTALGYLSYPWFLVESPKWLFASGRKAAAKAALLRLYRRHGLDTTAIEAMEIDEADSSVINQKSGTGLCESLRKVLPKENLCNIKYALVEVSFTLLFVANSMAYFSSSFRRDFITKDPYINVIISGALELPAAFVAWLLTGRCGRRLSNILLLIPAGILLILVPFVPQSESVLFGAKSVCALLSKFLITISFSIVLIYGSESVPTTIRATSFIIASQVMRLGQMLAPELTVLLESVTPALSNLFYGSFCVGSGLLLVFLAETHNRPMPDTIAEMEGLRMPSACRRWSLPCGGGKVAVEIDELAAAKCV